MRSLSDKAALLIAANLTKYAVGFVLPMVLVRLLTRDDYGTYQQLVLIGNIANAVMVLGLPVSVYYFYHRRAEDPSARPTLIAQTQIMLLLAGLAAGAALYLLQPVLAVHLRNEALGSLLHTYALYVGLLLAGEHFMHVMISQNRYVLAVGLETAETAFRVALLIFVLVVDRSLQSLVISLACYAGLRLLIRSYWLWHGPDSIHRASWRASFPAAQLAYSLPLAATAFVNVAAGQLNRVIVAMYFSPIDYAIYSVGALEIPVDVIFQGSVTTVLRASLPSLAMEGRTREIVRIWRESVRKLSILIVPSFVFLMFFSANFIIALFTPRYAASVGVFRIYVALIPLWMFVLSIVPQVYGKTRINMHVTAVTVVTNVVLSFVLLRYIGYLGPAVAMLISNCLSSLLFYFSTRSLLHATARQLIPLAAIGRALLSSIIAVVPGALAEAALGHGLVSLAIEGFTFAATYFAAGYFLRVFMPNDLARIRAWLLRLRAMTPWRSGAGGP